MNYNQKSDFYPRMTAGKGILFFFSVFVLMFILLSFVSALLLMKMKNTEAMMRISAVLQDVFVFILPALVTAIMMTRLPARFLMIERLPRFWPLIIGIATLYCAMPWLECVIQWNNSITFPPQLKGLELALREMENSAQEMINEMLRGSTVGSLIVSVCIIGVLAGLSEELFFRGAMLRLFSMTRINYHVAIWAVALVFSMLHFQFFGFVPRLLLGGFFGYLAWWSKCLWIPIVVHVLNNSTVVVIEWLTPSNDTSATSSELGAFNPNWALIIASVFLTIGGLYLFWKNTRYEN